MNNKTSDLKRIYDEIEIPKELDFVIEDAFKKGRTEKMSVKVNHKRKSWKRVATGIAVGLVLFTTAINTVPSFAEAMEEIPVLGDLVQVLQFNKGKGQGGKITDGVDVKFISLQQEKDQEVITLNFMDDDKAMENAPYFDVVYKENPHSLTFSIGGARRMTAEKDFEALKESKFVKDVYKIITLDDSLVRFNVIFDQAVELKVEEYENPAQVVIKLKEDKGAENKTMYFVRTASYGFGEELGIAEEMLFEIEDKRVLKDEKDTYFIEVGTFESLEEAEKALEELKGQVGEAMELHIEERDGNVVPKAISNN